MISENPRIGFIGFGAVAYYMSKGLKGAGIKQIKVVDLPTCNDMVRKRATETGVKLVSNLGELISWSEIIVSSVWGNISLKVAEEAVSFMSSGKMFVDLNNSSPQSKRAAAELVNAKGAKFVDVALMSVPKEEGHKTPMYVSGDGAEEFKSIMSKYGMGDGTNSNRGSSETPRITC
jgi:3-hydroxyisobutyrate dehydrogenase-like beta-hydroxyacid dehydrogenase